jgi:acetoin utilization protein AcuB
LHLDEHKEPAMVVEEIMTESPITVRADTTIRETIKTLFEMDVRHLPVVEGGALVGIVSDRDLRAYLAPAMLELERPSEIAAQQKRPVSSIMQSDVLSVTPETEIEEVIDLMLEQKVGAIPVVRAGSQELVGIVSYVDVLRAAQGLFEQ